MIAIAIIIAITNTITTITTMTITVITTIVMTRAFVVDGQTSRERLGIVGGGARVGQLFHVDKGVRGALL